MSRIEMTLTGFLSSVTGTYSNPLPSMSERQSFTRVLRSTHVTLSGRYVPQARQGFAAYLSHGAPVGIWRALCSGGKRCGLVAMLGAYSRIVALLTPELNLATSAREISCGGRSSNGTTLCT